MAASVLSAPHFQDETAAFAYVEAHLWPKGPVCPHCGNTDQAKIGHLQGKTTRPGLRKCYECKKPFTVRQGSIFESSHLPLHLWLQVIHLMCASKKGIATRQIQRLLNCSMKTAWFLGHRIRETMKADGSEPMGGEGTTIEADETYFSPKARRYRPDGTKKPGSDKKRKIVTLVERGGAARSFHVEFTDTPTIKRLIAENVAKGGALMTDESGIYSGVGSKFYGHFAEHGKTMHSAGVYVDKDDSNIHSNTVEGFFSVFKRGMRGIYQHCDEQHLQRYLTEFDFRYSNREKLGVDDTKRASLALKGAKGKRLTYETTADDPRA